MFHWKSHHHITVDVMSESVSFENVTYVTYESVTISLWVQTPLELYDSFALCHFLTIVYPISQFYTSNGETVQL